MTTAQIIFMGLAGMEDAQIKSGNGLVERTEGGEGDMAESMSVKDYAKMRQANKPGTEVFEARQQIKSGQKRMRSVLENRIRRLVKDDLRHQ